jgi:hypothetical protein
MSSCDCCKKDSKVDLFQTIDDLQISKEVDQHFEAYLAKWFNNENNCQMDHKLPLIPTLNYEDEPHFTCHT